MVTGAFRSLFNKEHPMKKILWLFLLPVLIMSCDQESKKIYQSEKFVIEPDRVVQGDYTAKAVSRKEIQSNYRSTASDNFSRLITFKFSINEKDNENPSGKDHWLIVDEENQSPIIVFGQDPGPQPDHPGNNLPLNYQYTFRVDMSPVIDAFDSVGYYTTFEGKKIAKEDFKAVYIAGGSKPLSWDFSNLEENQLKMHDEDGDNIYELTVKLNPYNNEVRKQRLWKLSTDISAKPVYKSDQVLVDALFNLSLEEALMNIEADSTLRTGAKWSGVWTRDISYSIFLAFAYHEPGIAKISLLKKVKRGRIIQDTGSGGAWPVSSDRTTWALAAWELYKVTGEKAWLEQAFEIISNTLEDDYKTLYCERTGMYRGESSFLDWREQTYPRWMSNKDIFLSQNLGTNVVHYQAHRIAAEMAKELNRPGEKFAQRAERIKKGINHHLWMPDKGFYGQYLYGRTYLNLSPRFEALGEALAILFEVADEQRAEKVVSNAPLTPFGITCIYPQIPDIPPYHNNGIWPFVQAYWNLAAAKTGNEKALNHGLASIYRPTALFLSNYENFVAENGDYVGTEINSHRMLWSMAGNMAMVHRVFMGMQFETNGIYFKPAIPAGYGGKKSLTNFKYRKATLSIVVKGYGNEIKRIWLDGKRLQEPFIPGDISGHHEIEIEMNNHSFDSSPANFVKNRFSLAYPKVKAATYKISWIPVEKSAVYKVYRNDEMVGTTKNNSHEISNEGTLNEYMVVAVDEEGYESFGSEPEMIYSNKSKHIVELESDLAKSDKPYSNFSAKGFVEISQQENLDITISFEVAEAGKYRVDFRYSNGTGPWNTDNNCAIRSLYHNGDFQDVVVMPQRGEGEWSDWGFTNPVILDLKSGENQLQLRFREWNTNMDGEINKAMLDYMRLIKVK